MRTSNAERFAPLTGVAVLVLALVGALVLYPSDAPEFMDEPAAIASFYTENGTDVLPALVCYLLASTLLVWFAGSLRSHLRLAEGGTGRLATIAFGGGVAAATLLLASASVESAAALRVDEQGAIDVPTATVYSDLSALLFGLAAPYGMAVLLGASALAAFRFRALPVWLGALGALVAIVCLIPPISFVGIIISFFWVGATGVVLFMGAGAGAAAAPPRAGAEPAQPV